MTRTMSSSAEKVLTLAAVLTSDTALTAALARTVETVDDSRGSAAGRHPGPLPARPLAPRARLLQVHRAVPPAACRARPCAGLSAGCPGDARPNHRGAVPLGPPDQPAAAAVGPAAGAVPPGRHWRADADPARRQARARRRTGPLFALVDPQ